MLYFSVLGAFIQTILYLCCIKTVFILLIPLRIKTHTTIHNSQQKIKAPFIKNVRGKKSRGGMKTVKQLSLRKK